MYLGRTLSVRSFILRVLERGEALDLPLLIRMPDGYYSQIETTAEFGEETTPDGRRAYVIWAKGKDGKFGGGKD